MDRSIACPPESVANAFASAILSNIVCHQYGFRNLSYN